MISNLYKNMQEHFESVCNFSGDVHSGITEAIGINEFSKAFGAYYFINSCLSINSFDHIQGMIKSGFLSLYIHEMNASLFKIPQNKQYGKNLGDHLIFTLLAMNSVSSKMYMSKYKHTIEDIYSHIDLQVIGLACLLHDVGKVYDVNNHAKIGADIACKFSIQHVKFLDKKIEACTDLYNIILNHMRPLGYQRGEQWSDGAVKNFIVDCGGTSQALSTVFVAMCDKYASTRNLDFLERLIELCDRIIRMRNSLEKSEN